MFSRNMHKLDSLVRIFLGGALVWIGFFDGSFISSVWVGAAVGLFGVLNVFSGVTGFCPVYHMAGFSSKPKEE